MSGVMELVIIFLLGFFIGRFIGSRDRSRPSPRFAEHRSRDADQGREGDRD